MYYVINIVENAKNSISTRTTSWIPTRLGSKWGTRPSLLAVTESHHAAGANSLSSVLFLLDLSAAFNTVNHQILLSTLEGMGVSGSALSLFASYLTGRSYQVTLRRSVSTTQAHHWGSASLGAGPSSLLFLHHISQRQRYYPLP